jgi:hypothetical protein
LGSAKGMTLSQDTDCLIPKLPTSKAIVTGRRRQQTSLSNKVAVPHTKEKQARVIPYLYDEEKINGKEMLRLNSQRLDLVRHVAKKLYKDSFSYREGTKIINDANLGREITPMGLRAVLLDNKIIKYNNVDKVFKSKKTPRKSKKKKSKKVKNIDKIKSFEDYTPRCLDGKKITEHYKKLISLLPYSRDLVIEHMQPRNPRHKKYCGLHTLDNIQILPKRLNSIKSDMDWKEWQDYLITKDQEKTVSFFQYCIQELSKHNLKFKKVYNNNLKSWEYISCIDKSKLLMNNVNMFRKDI